MPIHIFVLHLLLFTLRSLYLCAIGHPAVFSLGSPSPPLHTALPTSATQHTHGHAYGHLPLCVAASHSLRPRHAHTTRLRQLPPGLVCFHSPLLAESSLVSSPPLNDMLKSRGLSCSQSTFGTPPPLVLSHVLPRPGCQCLPCGWSQNKTPAATPHHAASHHSTKPHKTKQLPDPAAGSPTAAMLRLISYLAHRTQTSQSSSGMPS